MISYDLRIQHDDYGNAPDLLDQADADAMERGEIRRVGGDARCQCGKIFYDHPPVIGALWLNRGCDGSLLKL